MTEEQIQNTIDKHNIPTKPGDELGLAFFISLINKQENDLNNKIDKLDKDLNNKIDKLDNRIDKIDSKIDSNFMWTVGMFATIFISIASIFIFIFTQNFI